MGTEPSTERMPSLDGLRGISILLVVFGHAFGHGLAPPGLRGIAPFFSGELGVLVFFVISGFLITTLLAAEIDRGVASLPRFYARRFVRLAPAQLVFIATLFLLTLVTPFRMSACQFATALTSTKNYGCRGWVDGHLWSLSVEEQFYLLWPSILIFLPRRQAASLALIMVLAAPASRGVEYAIHHRSFFWLTSNTDALMSGCLAGLYGRTERARRLVSWRPALGRTAAIALSAVPIYLNSHLNFGVENALFGQTLQAAAAAYLVLSFTQIRSGWLYRLLNWAPLCRVGILSYSLYLWQMPFVSTARDLGGLTSPLLIFPLNLVAAVCVAALSYTLLEQPLVGLRRALAARSPTARPPAEPQAVNASFQIETALGD